MEAKSLHEQRSILSGARGTVESRKSTQSNEFRNRAAEKLPRKVILGAEDIIQKGEKDEARSFERGTNRTRDRTERASERERKANIIAETIFLEMCATHRTLRRNKHFTVIHVIPSRGLNDPIRTDGLLSRGNQN